MAGPCVAVVIPAFDEVGTIGRVVAGILPYAIPIVVDDASTDDTGKTAELAGAVVVRHETNRGYDEAINSGFALAVQRGFEYLITMDADGQHPVRLIPKYLLLLKRFADVVAGTRPTKPRLAERFFGYVTRVLYGIRDPLCGMKGYRTALYREVGHFDSYTSIGTEMILYAVRHNYRIVQVNVPIVGRCGPSRFGMTLRADWQLLRSLILGLCSPLKYLIRVESTSDRKHQ